MKFIVTTDNLSAGTRRVQNAVSSKPILPILNNILIEAQNGQVCLTAFDNEMRITTAISAMVTEDGAITLPAKNFANIVGAQQSGDISIENDAGTNDVRFSCHKVKYNLNGISATDFPQADIFEEEWGFSISGHDLVESLKRVCYARSDDESRKALNGIYVSVKDGIRTVAATDGRRLALTEQAIENYQPPEPAEPVAEGEEEPAEKPSDFILPYKVVIELISSIDQSKEVKIHLTRSMAVFENGATAIMSKLVEQRYPNYRSVVPVNFDNEVSIPRVLFLDVLKRAKMMIGDNDNSVNLEIKENILEISASSEKGSFIETVDVTLKGEPITLSLNPDFLADPLKVLICDQFVIKFNNGFTPVQITGDTGFIYILMPMRN